MKVKPAFDPVPPDVVTATDPVAPTLTLAVISEGPTTVNDDAGTPPKLTLVTPVKFDPEIVTNVPSDPFCGANEFITGAGGMYVNPCNEAVPPGTITDTFPDAPSPTVAVIVVGETTV